MNSVVFLCVIASLIPGFIFSHFYLKGINEFSKTEKYNPISLHTFIAIIFSLSILLLTAIIIKILYGTIDFLFLNIKEINHLSLIINVTIIYSILFILGCWMGIYMSEKEILYKLIRPNTYWNHLFHQTDARFGGNKDVLITVILEIGKEAYLYYGILSDYKTFHDELEYIILTNVYRRKFNCDKSTNYSDESTRFHPIDVDQLQIKYDKILNLGMLFFEISQENSNDK